MQVEEVGESFYEKIVNSSTNHFVFLIDGKIWVFEKTYKTFKNESCEHHLVTVGSYAIAFDLEGKKWETRIDIPLLRHDDNSEHCLFVFDNAIHLFVYTAYSEIFYKDLFRWDKTKWRRRDFVDFLPIIHQRWSRIKAVVAESSDSVKEKYFVTSLDYVVRVQKLSLSEAGVLSIVPFHASDENLNRHMLSAHAAFHIKNQLIISYGYQRNSGRKWEKDTAIVLDLSTNKSVFKNVHCDDFNAKPEFNYNGALYFGVNPENEWLHITGKRMIDSGMPNVAEFDGDIWSIKNFEESPEWKYVGKIKSEASGLAVVDKNNDVIYFIGRETVYKFKM